MDYAKFIYKKEQVVREKYTAHFWYLINSETREGVHFHGHQYKDPKDAFSFYGENRHCFYAMGIEMHSKTPRHENHKALPNCQVTLGDCYCDGSSLSASERLGWINPDGSDDEHIWGVLHQFYGYWIEPRKDEEAA
jgi:hypothetical protein